MFLILDGPVDPYMLNHVVVFIYRECLMLLWASVRTQSQVCIDHGRKDAEKTENETKIACKAKINAGGEACMEPIRPTQYSSEFQTPPIHVW